MTLRRELLDLFVKSAGDYLDGWFESAPIKAAYGFDGIVGNYASPYTPGSAYVLLASRVRRGERQERRLGPCHRRNGRDHPGDGAGGGVARRRDAHAKPGARGASSRSGRAVGVVTERGESLRARCVISNLNPKLLYEKLLDPAALPGEFLERIRQWRCGSGTFRMNVALAELPDFTRAARPHRSRAPHRGHHHGAEPRLHGSSLSRRQGGRVVAAPDRRDADPIDAGRQPRAAGTTRGEPVLPARGARTAGRRLVGRASRAGRGRHGRSGEPACAQLQGVDPRPSDPEPARPRAHLRSVRAAISFTARSASISCSRRGRCWGMAITAGRSRDCTCAAPERIRAAASPGRPGTTRRARSSPTSGAVGSPDAAACGQWCTAPPRRRPAPSDLRSGRLADAQSKSDRRP